MRKWVRYENGRVLEVNQKRLLDCALNFQKAYYEYKDGYGVEEVYRCFKPLLEKALSGEIKEPVKQTPETVAMREREIPLIFEDAVMAFSWALQSRPAVYSQLDKETIFHHRDRYIKEENGKTYILEYFEEDE